jgi:hypothetical protein
VSVFLCPESNSREKTKNWSSRTLPKRHCEAHDAESWTRARVRVDCGERRLRTPFLVLASGAPVAAAPLTPPPGPSRRLPPQMARKRTCDCFAAAALSRTEQYLQKHTLGLSPHDEMSRRFKVTKQTNAGDKKTSASHYRTVRRAEKFRFTFVSHTRGWRSAANLVIQYTCARFTPIKITEHHVCLCNELPFWLAPLSRNAAVRPRNWNEI